MKWYHNMKIGTRLIVGYLIIAFIAGAIGVVGVVNIQTIDELDTKLYETMTVPLAEMVHIAESYHRMRGNVKDVLLANSQMEIDEYENRIKERNADFDRYLESYEKTLFSDEDKAIIKDLKDDKKKYDALVSEAIKMAEMNNREGALRLLNGEGEKIRREIEAEYTRMMDIKVEAAKDTAESNTKTANAATVQMISLIIVGVSISVFLGFFIASSIRKPIHKMVVAAEKIADGDLDIAIDIDSKDEIGILAHAFKKMTDNTNEVMSTISAAAEQVAGGSRQVSDSSMALSQGATEQASSVEELTASLEEIASQTRQNADNANEANSLAENVKMNAAKGNTQMKEMLKAMDEINDSSSNISKIIKVIDEIAFQTNILALNAAVEAARAGQHGKGFAVVAEEVRNLAARSANAAKETTAMIEGSIKKVDGGTKIANETATALNSIVEGVTKVAHLVGDIAEASNEQASGIAQINQGIMQVSVVVQTNSATSEESAAASEELTSQAELLKNQVARFKLKKTYQSNSSYRGLQGINPNVLRMLEQMNDKKNISFMNEGYEEAAPSNSRKIVLSDKEFGKY